MNIYFESALYGLQITFAFLIAGPILVRAERQKTMSRNPNWVKSNSEFLSAYRTVSLLPLNAALFFLAILLVIAITVSSTRFLFAIHGPLFFLTVLALFFYYNKSENKVRIKIPKDDHQRASLVPRTLFRYIPAWTVLPLPILIFAVFALNGYGLYAGRITPGRVFGNIILHSLFLSIIAYGIFSNVNRRPYRTSNETDTLGRKFELQLIFATAYFFCFVSLYHAFGSMGPDMLLPQPPTLIHARLEGIPFSWSYFLNNFHYRIVDYAATIFLIIGSGWISMHQFYKKILLVDFKNPPILNDV